MGRRYPFLNKIGLEVECAVKSGTPHTFMRWRETSDGSISSHNGYAVEFVQKRLFRTRQRTKKALEEIYPHISEVNKSMGLHIHISVKNDDMYMDFASIRFFKYFVDKLENSPLYEKYYELKRRMEDNNKYACSAICDYDETKLIQWQITADDKKSVRYHAVNFCYSLHGTIEFRIFPAMEKVEGVTECINFVLDTMKSYIAEGKIQKQWAALVEVSDDLENVIVKEA